MIKKGEGKRGIEEKKEKKEKRKILSQGVS